MNDDEKRFNEALDAADKVLHEIIGLGLLGTAKGTEADVSEELVVRLWDHAARTVTALAALHEDTPQTIASDLFKHLPDEEEHRADIQRHVDELRHQLDEQG